jgi:spore maturation protein CgeB
MKILIIGDFIVDFHEEAFAKGFEKKGFTVVKFRIDNYFASAGSLDKKNTRLLGLYQRFQKKYAFGPIISKLNKDLLKQFRLTKPDLVFIYRGVLVFPKMVKEMHKTSKVFLYNNDDPFGENYKKYFWRHYKNGLQYADWIFYYRHKNHNDYLNLGFKNISILRSYYTEERNFAIESLQNNKIYDVIFLGHYEADGRDLVLINLISNTNYNIKVFGPGWEKSPNYKTLKELQGNIEPVREKYNETINKAKIALVFFSKLNNDTYTRRVFEITATKTLMLSEFTDDMASLFTPNVEACYFNNEDELLKQVEVLLSNNDQLMKIAHNGYARTIHDGHSINDRVNEVLRIFDKLDDEIRN